MHQGDPIMPEQEIPLPGSPAAVPVPLSAADEDRNWFETVYQGGTVRQLSVRSIVTGMVIGAVMSISNLYVGLQTGWGLGVTITACILAYAVFRVLEVVVPRYRHDPFTILENYTMSSAASAAGYMATSGLVSTIPALYLTARRELAWWEMMSWLAAVSLLGVFMAIPLKRQLINVEKLPFPSGIATAETLRSLHDSGAAALAKARALVVAGVAGAVIGLWREGLPAVSEWLGKSSAAEGLAAASATTSSPSRLQGLLAKITLPEQFPLIPGDWGTTLMENYTLGWESSAIMVAAGAIIGIRVGVSLLLGAMCYYGILAPIGVANGWMTTGYKGIVSWTLWPATSMMLASSLLAFALRWRTVVRSFSGLAAVVGRRRVAHDPLADVEVPGSWFVAGTLVGGIACVALGHLLFGIPWWAGIFAVLLTFLLSTVAARATGETDITPISALGKMTQLTFGAMMPPNSTVNLMAASITAGASAHSADLLTDLKSGYLLGGNPRKQTISQLFGVLAGTLVCVPVYAIVVDPGKLGSKELPAPSAKVWAAVAEMFSKGLDALPPYAGWAILIGALIGIALTLMEEFAPPKYRRWIPSPTGLGIAGVVPAFNSLSMFAGAAIAWAVARAAPKLDEQYTIPVSSGLIAGESLMGVTVRLVAEAAKLLAR
ncbi:MAG TPA: OPT family oligopeptide transporter [Pirellulales bacterium]|nr:OPT family oligopeptide transporter [Pirellulales bacterium]